MWGYPNNRNYNYKNIATKFSKRGKTNNKVFMIFMQMLNTNCTQWDENGIQAAIDYIKKKSPKRKLD